MQICRELVDREGRLQQSLVIQAPKYNKHYILPGNFYIPQTVQPQKKKKEKKAYLVVINISSTFIR